MINNESLPIMTQTVANRMLPYGNQNIPTNTKFTMEQQYAAMQQAMSQQYPQQRQLSDPYTEGSTLLSQSSEFIRQEISNDKNFQQIDFELGETIKNVLYANAVQYILQDQQGRIMVEKWHNTIKQLKQDASQLESQKMQELMRSQSTIEMLAQDPIISKRLAELQNQQNSQQSQIKKTQKSETQNQEVENIEQ